VEIIIKIFILKYSVNTCTISQNYNKSSIIAADHSDSNKIPSVNIFIKPSNKVLDIENNIQYFYDESLKNIKVSDSLLRKNYDISHLEYYNSICNNSVFSVEKEKQKLMSNCKY
jgi:hypothetical protein